MKDVLELPVYVEPIGDPMQPAEGLLSNTLPAAETGTLDATSQPDSELVGDQSLDLITDDSSEAAEDVTSPEGLDADFPLRATAKAIRRRFSITRDQSGDGGSPQGPDESGGAEEQSTDTPASGGRGGKPPRSGEPRGSAFSEDPGDEGRSRRDQPGEIHGFRRGRREEAVRRAEELEQQGIDTSLSRNRTYPGAWPRHRHRGPGTWAAAAALGLTLGVGAYAAIHYDLQKAVPNPQHVVPPSVLGPLNPIEGQAAPAVLQQEIGRLVAQTNADSNLAIDLVHDGVFSETFRNKRGNWVSVLKVAMGSANGEIASVTVISKDKSTEPGANLKPQPGSASALQFHSADFTEFGGQALVLSVNEGKTLAVASNIQTSTVNPTFRKDEITTRLGQGTTETITTNSRGHHHTQFNNYPEAVTPQLDDRVSVAEADAANVLSKISGRLLALSLNPPGRLGGQPPFTTPEG